MNYEHHYNAARFGSLQEKAAASSTERLSNWKDAVQEIHTWPEYRQEPLRGLDGAAQHIGIKQLFIKDESKRFGTELGSFKALGAPYTVYRILADKVQSQLGLVPTSQELRSGKYRDITQKVTVCVATDGNQGRGLAYGAKIFGCRCVDYVHRHVSTGRVDVMKDLGAIVIRVDGEYELSVERAKEDARMNDWYFVSSTSWSSFDESIPRHVMNGYMVVVEEVFDTLKDIEQLTHVFVCGGVGSIAAAVFLGFYSRLKHLPIESSMPRFIVVEPLEADCLLQSGRSGETQSSAGNLHTVMAGLACRRPSPAALEILMWLASDFIAVPDSAAIEGMRMLARAGYGDIPVVCGESSAASMGILLRTKTDTVLKEKLGLNAESQVLLFGLEGATDPAVYRELVGFDAEEVYATQRSFDRERRM